MRDLLGLAFEAIESPSMDCADIALFQLSFGDIIVAGGSDQVAAWRKIMRCLVACINVAPFCNDWKFLF